MATQMTTVRRLKHKRGIVLCGFAFVCCVTPAPLPVKTIPVVAWFDDYNEVLEGTASVHEFLRGGSLDLRSRVGSARCVGRSDVRVVPPSADPPERCHGVRGEAQLSCSDGRQLAIEWQAGETCANGSGKGIDQHGNSIQLIYGGSDVRARKIAQVALEGQARKPALPAFSDRIDVRGTSLTMGTAFFVTGDGYLVTSYHVVKDGRRIQVQLDEDLLDAVLVGADQQNDLALLRVDAVRSPLALRVGSTLAKGEEVFTLGYPLVRLQGRDPKATFGRVNALTGPASDERFMQIDVPVQPGNSGGPLLDTSGQVVGVVTSMLHPAATFRLAGGFPQNVNYALKSDYVHSLLRQNLSEELVLEKPSTDEQDFSDLISRVEDSIVLVVAW